MNIEEILKEIVNFGFPTVVAVYLLFIFGEKIDNLNRSVEKLSRQIEGLNKYIEGLSKK